MVVFEFSKENRKSAIELNNTYEDALLIDVNSLSGNDIIQVIIPLTTLVATLAPIAIKLIESKTCTIKYDGVEISGLSADKAIDVIKQIEDLKKEKEQ